MKKRGWVRFRASGLSMERLLNEAGRQGVRLRGVRREKHREIIARATPEDYMRFCEIAREKGYQVSEAEPVGALRWRERYGKRAGLLLGLAAASFLLVWALGFIWSVRVENAGPYAGEISAYLLEAGIRPGVRRDAVPLSELRDKLEWRFPQIKWIRAEYAGTALVIRVEEGTPPPEIADQGGPGDVVAAEDGLLLRLTAYAGTPEAEAGQWVRAGQVLIRGEERGKDGEAVPVKARGEAVARVWVSREVRMDAREYRTVPTGAQTGLRAILAPFFRWRSGDPPDYAAYDLEKTVTPVVGAWFPVAVEKSVYFEAETEAAPRNREELCREAGEAALLLLHQALIADETVDKWIKYRIIEEDTLAATATAEIRRDIGRYRKE